MHKKTIIKLLLTAMTIYFAVIPIMVDIGEGHLFNPEWAAHSRVHLVWFLSFTALVSAVSIYHMWVNDDIFIPALIGLSFNSCFVLAYFTAPLYGGTDPGETVQLFPLSDIPPNLTENLILGILFFRYRYLSAHKSR